MLTPFLKKNTAKTLGFDWVFLDKHHGIIFFRPYTW